MKSFKKLFFIPVLALGVISCYPESKDTECPASEKVECPKCETNNPSSSSNPDASEHASIPSDPNQLEANYTNMYIPKSKTRQLVVSNLEEGVTLSYESSNINIATVTSSGLVTSSTTEGICYITITSSNSKKKIVTINVVDESRYWIVSNDVIVGCLDSEIDDLTLPSGYKKVANNAFERFTKLKRITVPEGYTELGNFSFIGCDSLEEINLPSTLMGFGYQIGIQNTVKRINIPSSNPYMSVVKSHTVLHTTSANPIAPNYLLFAFNNFSGFINQTAQSIIAPFAFATLQSFSEISFTSGVKYYGDYAFAFSSISRFVYPKDTTYVGKGCFLGCEHLNTISRNNDSGGNPTYYLGGSYAQGYVFYTSQITDPRQCVAAGHIHGDKYTTPVLASVEHTAINELAYCRNIDCEKLVISNDVVKLGGLSFGYNKNLKHVFVPANVEIDLFPESSDLQYFLYGEYPYNQKASEIIEPCGPFAGCNEELTVYSLATNEDSSDSVEEPTEGEGDNTGTGDETGDEPGSDPEQEPKVLTDGRSEEDVQKLCRNFNGLSNFKYKVISQEEYNEIFGD